MTRENTPLNILERQFEHLQHQLEEMMDMWDGDQLDRPRTGFGRARIGVDLVDRGEEFVLHADIPGYEREEIDVRVADDTLHISASHEDDHVEADEGHYIKSERRHKSMSRKVRLPEPVDESDVEGMYHNGVLTVTLPKREPSESDSKQIEIQ